MLTTLSFSISLCKATGQPGDNWPTLRFLQAESNSSPTLCFSIAEIITPARLSTGTLHPRSWPINYSVIGLPQRSRDCACHIPSERGHLWQPCPKLGVMLFRDCLRLVSLWAKVELLEESHAEKKLWTSSILALCILSLVENSPRRTRSIHERHNECEGTAARHCHTIVPLQQFLLKGHLEGGTTLWYIHYDIPLWPLHLHVPRADVYREQARIQWWQWESESTWPL